MKRGYLFPTAFIAAISSLVLFPVHVKADIPEVNSAYKEIIDSFAQNISMTEFAIYDIDQDGTDELIISSGNNSADWMNYVYTLNDQNSIILTGQFSSQVGLYGLESGPGMLSVFGKMGDQTVTLLTLNSEKELVETEVLANQVDFSNGEDYYENEYPIQLFSADVLYLPESFYETWYIDHNKFMSSDKITHLTINYTDDGYFHLSLNGIKYSCSFDGNYLFLADDGIGAKYTNFDGTTLTVYPESPYRLVLDGYDEYRDGTYSEQ